MILNPVISDKFYKAILDTIPSPVFVFDGDVRIIDCNAGAGALLEKEPEYYLRTRGGDALHCVHSLEAPGGCGHAEVCKTCVIRNSVKSSISGLKTVRQKHVLHLVREDKIRDIHVYVTTSPFEHNGGRYVLLILEDITEIAEAKEQASREKEFLSLVIDSLPHPFYVIDARDFTILAANAAALNGSLPANLKCYAHAHGKTGPCSEKEHPCPLSEVSRTKKPVVLEHIHYDLKGEPRNYEVHGYPIFDNNKNVIQLIEYALDITDRKQMEAEREKLVAELREALAKVKTLSGLLPICASCKKIRDDEGYWHQLETYISEHSDTAFTHAICPECGMKLYPEHYDNVWGKEGR